MKSTHEGEISMTLANNAVKLQASTVNTFRTIQNKLYELNVHFHTFTLREERTLKALLRHIRSSFSKKSIKDELGPIGFDPKFIKKFIKHGRKLSMYIVTLPNIPQCK